MAITHYLFDREEGVFVPVATHAFPRRTQKSLGLDPVLRNIRDVDGPFREEVEG